LTGHDIAEPLLAEAQWTAQESAVTTSIIVPAYNEEDGLPLVLEQISSVIHGEYEVIVVDDGSTDGTSEVARRFPFRVVKHEANLGKGEALKTGIACARGENIIWIDADNSYPADKIPQIANLLSNGVDLVYASRVKGRERIPAFNRFGNAVISLLVRGIYGFKLRDPCTGLCGVKRRHLEVMGLSSRGFSIEVEIAIKASRMKLKMAEVPIEYQPRVGVSKLSAVRDGFRILMGILRHIFWRPELSRSR
jgi:glycosyltransferase involved in cell wall biosynthesis